MSQTSHPHKKRLGNMSFTGIYFSMSLALFIMGMFGLLVLLTHNLTQKIKQSVEMNIFLKRNVKSHEIISLRQRVERMHFVAKTDTGPALTFISKEQASKTLAEEIGEDFIRYIGENPLSDLLIIQIDPEYQTPAQFKIIQQKLEQLPSVLEVTYVEHLVKNINENVTKIGGGLIGLAVLLFLAVVLIIHHAIRLALFSQRFMIRSMQLVGAQGSFIRRPFLLRASIYGLFAGGTACAGLHILINVSKQQLPYLNGLENLQEITILYIIVLFVGLVTSYTSTFSAISRYLRMSLDDLY